MKTANLFAILLLLSVVSADSFTFQGSGAVVDGNGTVTVDNWQIGYGAQQITQVNSLDSGIVVAALVVLAFGLIYIAMEGEDV